MLGALGRKTVQVHVTRTCNLRCRHCYSSSGPEEKESLPIATIRAILEACAGQGYQCVSFSGGEPLLYPDLEEAASCAKDLGLRVTMVTNGMLLHRNRWTRIAPLVDLVAVSLDGTEEIHNRLRNSENAYASMEANLGCLQESGVPFGFIHTATSESLAFLPALSDYAVEKGAGLLQLHPLGLVGAAASDPSLNDLHGDGETLTRIYLMARALQQKHGERLKVHVDLFNREIVRECPEMVYATVLDRVPNEPFSELVNPLVIMSNGDVSPVCHGLPPGFLIGNAIESDLERCFRDYREDGYLRFREFCAELLDRILPDLDWPYFNWYEIFEQATLKLDGNGCRSEGSGEVAMAVGTVFPGESGGRI